MNDPTRATIEEDTIRNKEDMAKKKSILFAKCRRGLPTKQWYPCIKKLMDFGVATEDDWGVVRENVGSSIAMKTAEAMGFPLDSENVMDIRN